MPYIEMAVNAEDQQFFHKKLEQRARRGTAALLGYVTAMLTPAAVILIHNFGAETTRELLCDLVDAAIRRASDKIETKQ